MGVVLVKAWLTTPTHLELWHAILEGRHVIDVIAL